MEGNVLIDPESIKRIAREQGLPAGIVEKDYAITILLAILAELPFANRMVFKGGTAIKKMYFPEARFSEDLDFTCYEDISKTLIEHLERVIKGRNWLGVRFTEVDLEETRSPKSARVVVRYLDFNDHPNRINLDLSIREKPILKTNLKTMPDNYNIGKELTCSYLHLSTFDNLLKRKTGTCELRQNAFTSKSTCFTCDDFTYDPAIELNDKLKAISIRTMGLNEILAEKVRALLKIERPRHLYDIWFLLSKGVEVSIQLIDQKLKLYNEKFEIEKMNKVALKLRDSWERDLKPLIPKAEVPSIDYVEKEVIKAFQATE